MIYGETTVVAKTMMSEVVSIAKRDLKAGETIGGIGSADIYHKIYTYKDARQMKGIPMGIASGARIMKDVQKGSPLTEENTVPDASQFVYQLRKMQDDMLAREERLNK